MTREGERVRRIAALARDTKEADRAEREENEAQGVLRGRLTKLIRAFPALEQAARRAEGFEVKVICPEELDLLRVCIRKMEHLPTFCAVFADDHITHLSSAQYRVLLDWLEGEVGEGEKI